MDSFAARPWFGKAALLAVAFYGVCGAGDLARFAFKAGDRSGYLYGVRYELFDTGRPLKVVYQDGSPVAAQELNGDTPAGENYRPDRIRAHLRNMSGVTSYIGDSHGWSSPWGVSRYRSTFSFIAPSSAFNYPSFQQWFYLVKQRTIIGMSPTRKIAIGRLDNQGFQPVSAIPIPFPPDLEVQSAAQAGLHLWTPHDIRYVNLANQRITHLSLPLSGPVSGVATVFIRDSSTMWTVAALSTGLAIYKQKEEDHVITFPYHRDVNRWGSISVHSNDAGDRFYVRYDPSMWIPKKERMLMNSYLEELTMQGEVVHSYTLPPSENFPAPRRWIDLPERFLQSPAFFFGTMLYQKAGAMMGNNRLQAALGGRFGDNLSKTKETAAYILVLSVLCATVTFYWARRAQIPRQQAWAWTGFALLFNLAGLIVFRLLADWPQLIPCTACGRCRPVTDDYCPHCTQGWPPPNPNGTEIMDYPQLNGFETRPTV